MGRGQESANSGLAGLGGEKMIRSPSRAPHATAVSTPPGLLPLGDEPVPRGSEERHRSPDEEAVWPEEAQHVHLGVNAR